MVYPVVRATFLLDWSPKATAYFCGFVKCLFAISSNFFSLHNMQSRVRDTQKDDPRSLVDQGLGIPKGYKYIRGGIRIRPIPSCCKVATSGNQLKFQCFIP